MSLIILEKLKKKKSLISDFVIEVIFNNEIYLIEDSSNTHEGETKNHSLQKKQAIRFHIYSIH